MTFTGDTLFLAGCGRFFEGNAEQMYNAFAILGSLPDNTKVYCGHEYTLQNLRFAAHVEPSNQEILKKIAWSELRREDGKPTVCIHFNFCFIRYLFIIYLTWTKFFSSPGAINNWWGEDIQSLHESIWGRDNAACRSTECYSGHEKYPFRERFIPIKEIYNVTYLACIQLFKQWKYLLW